MDRDDVDVLPCAPDTDTNDARDRKAREQRRYCSEMLRRGSSGVLSPELHNPLQRQLECAPAAAAIQKVLQRQLAQPESA